MKNILWKYAPWVSDSFNLLTQDTRLKTLRLCMCMNLKLSMSVSFRFLTMDIRERRTHRWRVKTGTSVTTVTRCARMPTHWDAIAGKLMARTAVMSAVSATRLSRELHTWRSESDDKQLPLYRQSGVYEWIPCMKETHILFLVICAPPPPPQVENTIDLRVGEESVVSLYEEKLRNFIKLISDRLL